MNAMEKVSNLRSDIPEFRPGDTVRVHVKIKEGDKERLQAYEGTVLARKNTGMGETITVRKISFGHGSSASSTFMRRSSITSMSCALAESAGQSFTTFAD